MVSGRVALVAAWALALGMGCSSLPARQPAALARGQSAPPVEMPASPRIPARPVSASPTARPVDLMPAVNARPAVERVSGPPKVEAAAVPEIPVTAPADGLVPLRRLQRLTAERYAAMDSYIVRLRRREQVRGKDKPEEVILLKFRKEPWSVHLKWIGAEGNGREVLYVKGHYEDKLHTLLASGDMPFAPAGKRISLAPDSTLVRSASRHAITEAGVGSLVERFGSLVEATARSDPRSPGLRHLGLKQRPEMPNVALEAVEEVLPPGREADLPRGGRRQVYFDTAVALPVLVVTQDDRGHEVEYYCYDRFQFPVKLDEHDFNPEVLWRPMKK